MRPHFTFMEIRQFSRILALQHEGTAVRRVSTVNARTDSKRLGSLASRLTHTCAKV
jgi:hypothetical protein